MTVIWLVAHTPQVLMFGAWNSWGVALAVCLAIDFLWALRATGRRGSHVVG
jgi:hypothetical protein